MNFRDLEVIPYTRFNFDEDVMFQLPLICLGGVKMTNISSFRFETQYLGDVLLGFRADCYPRKFLLKKIFVKNSSSTKEIEINKEFSCDRAYFAEPISLFWKDLEFEIEADDSFQNLYGIYGRFYEKKDTEKFVGVPIEEIKFVNRIPIQVQEFSKVFRQCLSDLPDLFAKRMIDHLNSESV